MHMVVQACVNCDAELHATAYTARHARLSIEDASAAMDIDPVTGENQSSPRLLTNLHY